MERLQPDEPFLGMIKCIYSRPVLPRYLLLRMMGTSASRAVVGGQANLPPASLDFTDPGAFKVKSWTELLRALGVFCFCSFPTLVNNSMKVGHYSGERCQLYPAGQ